MPDNFEFKDASAFVRTYLNTAERANVQRWQTQDGYTFEFHGGHTTGNPIYFRIDDNGDKSNLPKVDTKDKAFSDYFGSAGGRRTTSVSVAAFANGGKLLKGLPSAAQTDIEQIVTRSWPSLQLLADRYHSGTDAPADPPAAETHKTCGLGGCVGQVPIVLSGKAMCETCYQFS